jgi:hypothetical protein
MTSCRPSRRTSLPSLGGTSVALVRFAPPADECAARGLELVTRWLPPGCTEETTGAPKFLGNPDCPSAHVQSTPVGLSAPDHYGASAWPLVSKKQRLPRKVFRSSIAWLSDWLSTLRSGGRPAPRKTRFRPLVRRYRTGFPPARFQRKVSDQLPFISSSFPKLLGAIGSTEVTSSPVSNWLDGATRRAVFACRAGLKLGKQPRQASARSLVG